MTIRMSFTVATAGLEKRGFVSRAVRMGGGLLFSLFFFRRIGEITGTHTLGVVFVAIGRPQKMVEKPRTLLLGLGTS